MSSIDHVSAIERPVQAGDHVFLVDGSSFIFRAYFQSINQLAKYNYRSDRLPTGAVRFFCTKLFQFVRDGFHVWAFVLAPFWMLRHRLWLELIAYLLIVGGAIFALRRLGIEESAGFWVALILAVFIGMEASSLLRWKLARRGFENLGVVVGNKESMPAAYWFSNTSAGPA